MSGSSLRRKRAAAPQSLSFLSESTASNHHRLSVLRATGLVFFLSFFLLASLLATMSPTLQQLVLEH